MKPIKFQSKLIRTLENIPGLNILRENLYNSEFQAEKNYFVRKYQNNEQEIAQYISIKEEIKLQEINKKIKSLNLKGFIIPTNLIKKLPNDETLPLSTAKQLVIKSFCQMNNGKLNEAEGVHIIDTKTPKKLTKLAPNFCSQLISELHFNKKSRLTLGESHLQDESKLPFGQAILQISHLNYHSLDLDLSTQTTPDLESSKLTQEKLLLHEHCFSVPYSLNDHRNSPHGFILHLQGKKITPSIINQIIGFKENSFGGLAIISGDCTGEILLKTEKNIILNKYNFKHKIIHKQLNEVIGNILYEPLITGKQAIINAEKIGKINSIDGQITLVFFPLLQTFVVKY